MTDETGMIKDPRPWNIGGASGVFGARANPTKDVQEGMRFTRLKPPVLIAGRRPEPLSHDIILSTSIHHPHNL